MKKQKIDEFFAKPKANEEQKQTEKFAHSHLLSKIPTSSKQNEERELPHPKKIHRQR